MLMHASFPNDMQSIHSKFKQKAYSMSDIANKNFRYQQKCLNIFQRSEWHIATKQKYTNSKLLPVQIFEHPVFRNQVEVNIKGKKNNNSLVFISINYLQLKPQRVAFFHFYLSGAPVIASVARKKKPETPHY